MFRRKVKEFPHGELNKVERCNCYNALLKEFELILKNNNYTMSYDVSRMGYCGLRKGDRKPHLFLVRGDDNVRVDTIKYIYKKQVVSSYDILTMKQFNHLYGEITIGKAMMRYSELDEYLTPEDDAELAERRLRAIESRLRKRENEFTATAEHSESKPNGRKIEMTEEQIHDYEWLLEHTTMSLRKPNGEKNDRH